MSKVPIYAAKLTAVRKEMLALHERSQKLKVRAAFANHAPYSRLSPRQPPTAISLSLSLPPPPFPSLQKRTDKLMSKKKREEMSQAIAKDRARQREEALVAKPAEVAVIRATDATAAKEKRRRSRDG